MAKPIAMAALAFENWPQVFVLCEDGSVYRGGESYQTGRWSWDRLPAIPLTDAGDAEANDFGFEPATPEVRSGAPNGGENAAG